MNFEYKETIDKQRELVSLQKKVVSKSLVSALKVFLYIMCLAIVTGGFFGLGVIHGIIKSAPSVENISIVPSSYSTTVYDTNNKQIAKLITSGSNRIKADLKDIPEHLRWAFIDTEDARFYEHKGIDIQGKPGAQARAIFNGKVAAVFQLNGLFNILIRHGNYISVYCNLSSASVKTGDTVTTRQNIGQIFSDGADNGRTVLHFQLRKEKEKLNPEPWLSR